jgi:hypothetical protein
MQNFLDLATGLEVLQQEQDQQEQQQQQQHNALSDGQHQEQQQPLIDTNSPINDEALLAYPPTPPPSVRPINESLDSTESARFRGLAKMAKSDSVIKNIARPPSVTNLAFVSTEPGSPKSPKRVLQTTRGSDEAVKNIPRSLSRQNFLN